LRADQRITLRALGPGGRPHATEGHGSAAYRVCACSSAFALSERDFVIAIRLGERDLIGILGRVVVEGGQLVVDLAGRILNVLVGVLLGAREFHICLVLRFRDFGGHLIGGLSLMASGEQEAAEGQSG
jgi:hypothetical protein